MIKTKQASNNVTKFSSKRYLALTLLLLIVLACSNLPFLRSKLSNSPMLALIYWGVVILSILFYFPLIEAPAKLRQINIVKAYAISGGISYLAFSFLIGAFLKQIKASPYNLSPLGITHNLIIILLPLVARELIRSYAIGTIWKSSAHRHWAMFGLFLLFFISDINFSKLAVLESLEKIVIYIVSDVCLNFSLNILAFILCFYGGAKSSIYFLGIIQIFPKIFPFIPELPWLASGAIGLVFPILFALFVSDSCRLEAVQTRPKDIKSDTLYFISLFLSVMFAWFCIGVFSIYPSTILTGSMEPLIKPGDIVLIQRMYHESEINSLKKGDIINFKRESISITHRIEEILTDEAGNLSFVTKGDNNKSIDSSVVLPNDINGLIIGTIPKVGIPILLIYSQKDIPEGVSDYE